jgi:uncharacterized membrane protein YhhN
MIPAVYLIPGLAALVAVLVYAEIAGRRRLVYAVKPLCTLLVIAIAALAFQSPSVNRMYAFGVLAGLLLSMGGDMALMFPSNQRAFTTGVRLFLLAHAAYTVTFIALGQFSPVDIAPTVVIAAIGIGFYRLIRSGLGAMRPQVIVYIVVISLMLSRAGALCASEFSGAQRLMVFAGALLFYISDIILAAARFWKPWKYNRISLAFYYSGQTLLAFAASEW